MVAGVDVSVEVVSVGGVSVGAAFVSGVDPGGTGFIVALVCGSEAGVPLSSVPG